MSEPSRHRTFEPWSYVAVFVSAALIYAPSLRNGPVWDDLPLVINNTNLQGLQGLGQLFVNDLWSASAQGEPSSFYRPMAMVSFWLNGLLGGHSVASFRLGNIALHALNAVLLAAVLRQRRLMGPLAAAVIAFGWAVVPINSEPVLWISGRFDLLVASFALAALLGGGVARQAFGSQQRSWALPATLLAVCAGILSKESFMAWLPVLAIDDFLFGSSLAKGPAADEPPALRRHLAAKYGGIFALVVAYFLTRRQLGLPTAAVALDTGLGSVVESFFFLIATFARVLVWPTNLDPFRPYAPLSAGALALTLSLFAVATLLVLLWAWRSKSRSARFAVLGWAWFVLSTVPSALVGPNLDMIGDRYAYLPVVGLFCSLGALVARPAAPTRAQGFRSFAASLAVVALLGAQIWLNITHFPSWRDDEALARASLTSSPGNPYALYSLGRMAATRKDFGTADALLSESIKRDDRSWRTWNAICYVRMHQNRLDEAEAACRASLERHARNPRGWVNLASVGIRRRDWQAAAAAANQAVALKPSYAEGRYIAAVAAANLGKFDEAEQHLARGLESEPDHTRLRAFEQQLRARERALIQQNR
jgi:tetratricopeptide (TPR) repeat protein